jgi:hypothetical protein
MGLLWEICRLQPRRTQRSFGNGDFLSGRSSVPGSLWRVGRTSRVIHTGKPLGKGISLGRLHPGLENGKPPSQAGGLAANGSVRPWGAVGLAGQLRWRCAVRHGLCRRIDRGCRNRACAMDGSARQFELGASRWDARPVWVQPTAGGAGPGRRRKSDLWQRDCRRGSVGVWCGRVRE